LQLSILRSGGGDAARTRATEPHASPPPVFFRTAGLTERRVLKVSAFRIVVRKIDIS